MLTNQFTTQADSADNHSVDLDYLWLNRNYSSDGSNASNPDWFKTSASETRNSLDLFVNQKHTVEGSYGNYGGQKDGERVTEDSLTVRQNVVGEIISETWYTDGNPKQTSTTKTTDHYTQEQKKDGSGVIAGYHEVLDSDEDDVYQPYHDEYQAPPQEGAEQPGVEYVTNAAGGAEGGENSNSREQDGQQGEIFVYQTASVYDHLLVPEVSYFDDQPLLLDLEDEASSTFETDIQAGLNELESSSRRNFLDENKQPLPDWLLQSKTDSFHPFLLVEKQSFSLSEQRLLEIDRTKIKSVQVLGDKKGLGDKWLPQDKAKVQVFFLTGLKKDARNILNVAAPPVEQSLIITFKDGSREILLNNLPDANGLAGQALFMAPLLPKLRGATKPASNSAAVAEEGGQNLYKWNQPTST